MLNVKAGSKIHPTSQQKLAIVVAYVYFSLEHVYIFNIHGYDVLSILNFLLGLIICYIKVKDSLAKSIQDLQEINPVISRQSKIFKFSFQLVTQKIQF